MSWPADFSPWSKTREHCGRPTTNDRMDGRHKFLLWMDTPQQKPKVHRIAVGGMSAVHTGGHSGPIHGGQNRRLVLIMCE
jgi:hypothetical protein